MQQSSLKIHSRSFLLKGVHHIPKNPPAPYVISAHGMLSTKDSPKYIALGSELIKQGFGFVRFDFTGCGESSGSFNDSTLTQRIEDLTTVVSWVKNLESCNGTIGIFGSSLGGTVALLVSSLEKVGAVVLIATPVRQSTHISPELKEVYKHYPHFFEDFHKNLEKLSFKTIHHCLIIHGSKDRVVPPENAFFIYENISQPKEIWVVNNADHQFLDEALRKSMLRMTVQWFDRFME